MQKLKMKLSLLLIICLSLASCKDKTFPQITPKERCTIAFTEVEVVQGREFYQGICRCSLYQWSIASIGRVGPNYTKDVRYCDRMSGYSPDDTASIYTWQESIRLWLVRNSK